MYGVALILTMTSKYAWNSLSKDKPEFYRRVLLCDEFGWIFIGALTVQQDVYGNRNERFLTQSGDIPGNKIMFWMDLPEVPDECQIR